MDINLYEESTKEIQNLINLLTAAFPIFKQVDGFYLEVDTPFILNPEAKNPEWIYKTGVVFYPELLTYGSRSDGTFIVPWICVRFEIENKDRPKPVDKDLCKWFADIFKSIEYSPFMDEDSTYNHFIKKERRGWTSYKMYVHPSHPNGVWQNHTLSE
jgi:hypothetical protein